MKRLILIITGLLVFKSHFAQISYAPIEYIKFKTESPAAKPFQRYNELPSNEYTGIPDISIPLYTIKAGYSI